MFTICTHLSEHKKRKMSESIFLSKKIFNSDIFLHGKADGLSCTAGDSSAVVKADAIVTAVYKLSVAFIHTAVCVMG